MKPIKVIMYSKNNCPLCDKAKRVLEEIHEEFPIDIKEIDIYQDDELLEKYQLMIPVIEIDGEEIAFGMIQKEPIRKRLLEKIR
jgi:glutaredoxin